MLLRPLCALLAGLVLVVAAIPVRAADPIEIPAILPVTGPAAFLGKEFGETLKLIETRANAAGGIQGRPIHFAVQDDQSSPQVTVQLVGQALSKKPSLIVDGGPLALCAAAAPLVKDGPVMYCLSPSFHPDAGGFGFAIMSSSRDVLINGLDYYKSRGFKKIAILDGTDATGVDADAILADIIKLPAYAGMSYVASEHYNLADLSVSAQISRIKASGAQALIAYTTGPAIATVLHGMADNALDIPVFTSNGNMSTVQLDGYKPFLPKELLFAAYPALAADPIADAGVAQKADQFRTDMKSAGFAVDLLHAIPWDPGLLMVAAYARVGPAATAPQLRDAINAQVNWPGMLGRYDFHAVPNRGLGERAMTTVRWDPDRSVWTVAKMGGG